METIEMEEGRQTAKEIPKYYFMLKTIPSVWVLAQSVRCLPCKHRLELNGQNPCRTAMLGGTEAETGEFWGLLATQSSPSDKFQVQREACFKKNEVKNDSKTTPMLTSGLLITHVHKHPHEHACVHTFLYF